MVTEKTCTICGDTKGIHLFGVKSSNKDGHFNQCRECRRVNGGHKPRQYRQYPYEPETWLEQFALIVEMEIDGEPTKMEEARQTAREALEAATRDAKGTKAKMQARRRLERFDEFCGLADVYAGLLSTGEKELQLSPNHSAEWMSKRDSYMDKYTTSVVEQADDDLRHRVPIIGSSTEKEIRKHECVSFDDKFRNEWGEYTI